MSFTASCYRFKAHVHGQGLLKQIVIIPFKLINTDKNVSFDYFILCIYVFSDIFLDIHKHKFMHKTLTVCNKILKK